MSIYFILHSYITAVFNIYDYIFLCHSFNYGFRLHVKPQMYPRFSFSVEYVWFLSQCLEELCTIKAAVVSSVTSPKFGGIQTKQSF